MMQALNLAKIMFDWACKLFLKNLGLIIDRIELFIRKTIELSLQVRC